MSFAEYFTQSTKSQFLLLPCFIGVFELNAKSVNPDQMLHSVASDLGLHCLPMSLLSDARLIWVNLQIVHSSRCKPLSLSGQIQQMTNQ